MQRIVVLIIGFTTAAGFLIFTGPLSHASEDRWLSPMASSTIVHPFGMTSTYGPGHRGVDFGAEPGTPVRAVADGTVTWAAKVAGRLTLSIDHGDEKSTYEPLKPTVAVGDRVQRGDIVGTLLEGHSDCHPACLHLGRIKAGVYLDPAARFETNNGYRLISPEGAPPQPPAGVSSDGNIPTAGPHTSPFGVRTDPFSGKKTFHNGLDIGAPCGQPVMSVAPGTVTLAQNQGGYGLLVEVAHSGGTQTGYAHLSTISVNRADKVQRGTVLGRVGSTGRSTGCHLHFIKRENGRVVNPLGP